MNGDTPAFPTPPMPLDEDGCPGVAWHAGMTKREYIATRLLAGLRDSSMISNTSTLDGRTPTEWATWMADELLAALEERGG